MKTIRYRGFEIESKGKIKFVRLSKGRMIADSNILSLKKKIDDILYFNHTTVATPKESGLFWKEQNKRK